MKNTNTQKWFDKMEEKNSELTVEIDPTLIKKMIQAVRESENNEIAVIKIMRVLREENERN